MAETHDLQDVMTGNIEMKKVFTVKQVLIIIAFVVSVTSGATGIYYRFQSVEAQIQANVTAIEVLNEKTNINREDISNLKRESLKPNTTLTKPAK